MVHQRACSATQCLKDSVPPEQSKRKRVQGLCCNRVGTGDTQGCELFNNVISRRASEGDCEDYAMTWAQRTARYGITPETFQAALAKGVPAMRLGPSAQTVVEKTKEKP